MSESIKNLGEVNDLVHASTEEIRRPALFEHTKCLFAFLCVLFGVDAGNMFLDETVSGTRPECLFQIKESLHTVRRPRSLYVRIGKDVTSHYTQPFYCYFFSFSFSF